MAGRVHFRSIIFSLVFTLSLFFAVPSSPAWGQSAQITGAVTDLSKAVIPNASLEFINTATQVKWEARSNSDGFYVEPSLPPGTYRVTVQAPDFETQVAENVHLEVAGKASLNFILRPGRVTESVTVDATGLQLNTTDASVSTVIDRQFVENIPLNGRSFQSLMALVPGAALVPAEAGDSGEFTVNGQRTEENYYTVDGIAVQLKTVNIANPGEGGGYAGATPGETTLGTTQSLISVDALQEFRATTSTFSAEYGRTPGGQFSFNSRAGTNDWHGSAFEYLRNDVLDASNWFNGFTNDPPLAKPAERQNDFGGTLGGPIRIPKFYDGRNRTFFFFSYEGLRLSAPTTVSGGVPTVELRNATTPELRPFLNAFPVPTAQQEATSVDGMANYRTTYSNPSSLNVYGIRIDHSLTDKWKIFGRYADSQSNTSSFGVPGVEIQSSLLRGVTLGSTNVIAKNIANELRFNYTRADSSQTYGLTTQGGATLFDLSQIPGIGEPDAYLLFYIGYGPGAVLAFLPRHTIVDQINATDGLNVVLGRHSLKFGADYRRIANTIHFPPVHERPYFYSEDAVINDQTDSFDTYAQSIAVVRPVYSNLSLYAQDEWKASSRLNLSLGIRWDVNPPPKDADGNNPYTVTTADIATTRLAPAGTPLWQTTYTNFAPRLGLAYQIHQNPGHQTVFRTGIGLFYDTGYGQSAEGYEGVGFSGYEDFTGNSFPLTQPQIDSVPAASTAAPYNNTIFAFDPHLKLPFSVQWNAAIQQELSEKQNLTLSYVGSAGRRLLTEKTYDPSVLNNAPFSAGNDLYLTQNRAFSGYNSLQVQFQRSISHGLQALASYTWSHSIDNASSNTFAPELERAASDFDLRNNFQAGVTYDLPQQSYQNRLLRGAINGWAGDLRISSRSALPVDVISDSNIDPITGESLNFHPDRVAGQPLYVHDESAPGKRLINYLAFAPRHDANGNDLEGDAGRNVARSFNATQVDFAIRREFAVWDRLKLQLRVEAFNLLNHPIFGSIENYLSAGPPNIAGGSGFGLATTLQNSELGGLNALYQTGGPRSLQAALRLHF